MNIIHYSIRSFLTNEYYSIIRFTSKRLFVATLLLLSQNRSKLHKWRNCVSVIIDDSFPEHFIADRERCTNISASVTVSALLQVFLARMAVVTAPHKHILYIFKDYRWTLAKSIWSEEQWGMGNQTTIAFG